GSWKQRNWATRSLFCDLVTNCLLRFRRGAARNFLGQMLSGNGLHCGQLGLDLIEGAYDLRGPLDVVLNHLHYRLGRAAQLSKRLAIFNLLGYLRQQSLGGYKFARADRLLEVHSQKLFRDAIGGIQEWLSLSPRRYPSPASEAFPTFWRGSMADPRHGDVGEHLRQCSAFQLLRRRHRG